MIIAGLPAADDPINSVSSEDAAHITMIWLGDTDKSQATPADIEAMEAALANVAARHGPVTLRVTGREKLGDDEADVLMVDPAELLAVREELLGDETVKQTHDAVKQYPQWTPHVTLGYPENPATSNDIPDTITIDRLALWTGDSDGKEFPMGQANEPLTASRWVDFALTAAASVPSDDDDIVIALAVPEAARNYLGPGMLADDMFVPIAKLKRDKVALSSVLDAMQEVASSESTGVTATLPNEFALNDDGILWSRPKYDRLGIITSRALAALGGRGITSINRVDDPIIEVGLAAQVPDEYTMRPPEDFMFDRLAVVRGIDVFEFPFGSVTSAAMLASGAGLVIDGDALSAEDSPYDDAPQETVMESNLDKPMSGSKFRIPLIVPEGVPTGDGRRFMPLSLSTRDLPLPLMWQIKTGSAHDGSVIVGRVDSIERTEHGLGNAYGVFDAGPYGREAERLVREKFLRGISADLDNFEAVATEPEEEITLDGEDGEARTRKITGPTIDVSKARVMGVTLVAKPAFQECYIELVSDLVEEATGDEMDGVYEDDSDPAIVACALIASNIPLEPPAEWFENPKLTKPTALTITDDGRVFGHIAAWHVDHIGLPFGTKPPRSRSGYAYFHTGVVRTAEGHDVTVGQLTLAGGHAPLDMGYAKAVEHYDNTLSAVADVHAGEDAYGIWVAGALRPDATPERIRALRASKPSGDWRPISGRLELVAICQVNTPGFPVVRAQVASGHVVALVAAGAAPIADLIEARDDAITVEDRLRELTEFSVPKIDTDLDARRAGAIERVRALSVLNPEYTEFRAYSRETRDEYAKKGWAMPDGSYPIKDVGDLRRAIRAYGRAAKEDKPKVRKHIMKRARGLSRADLIPDNWVKSAAVRARMDLKAGTFTEDGVLDALVPMVSSLKFRRPRDFEEENHPRDDRGKFRKVLFRLGEDLEGKPGMAEASDAIEEAKIAEAGGDDAEIRRAAQRVVDVVDKVADATIDPNLADDLRSGSSDLSEAVARLPLAQGDPTEKMPYSELPDELQNLIEDLLVRAEQNLGEDEFDNIAGAIERFMSGAEMMTLEEVQGELNKILQALI